MVSGPLSTSFYTSVAQKLHTWAFEASLASAELTLHASKPDRVSPLNQTLSKSGEFSTFCVLTEKRCAQTASRQGEAGFCSLPGPPGSASPTLAWHKSLRCKTGQAGLWGSGFQESTQSVVCSIFSSFSLTRLSRVLDNTRRHIPLIIRRLFFPTQPEAASWQLRP